MTHLHLLQNLLLFAHYYLLLLSKIGMFINSMLTMLFCKGTLMRMSTWVYHQVSIPLKVILFAALINLFMDFDIHLVGGLQNSPPHYSQLVLNNLWLIPLYLLIIKETHHYMFLFMLTILSLLEITNKLWHDSFINLSLYSPLKTLALCNTFLALKFLAQRKVYFFVNESTFLTFHMILVYQIPNLLPSLWNKLLPTDGDLFQDPGQFHCLIDLLLYLTVTHPDINYAVTYLCQFMQKPHTPHFYVAMRILRYLKGTIGHFIMLSSKSDLSLKDLTNFDWAGCPTTRRSTTAYFVMMGATPISWKSKK